MTGLFGALNTSTSGLRAQQAALQTTSHNLANTNTQGYSRQRVTMEANMPQSYAGAGQIGSGVLINGITRITDDFVNMQLQNESASLSRFQQKSDVLGQLEAVYNEPSTTGVAHQMSEFFVSWSNLAANPESVTSKSMVLRQSETFLDTVNHASNKMGEIADETLALIDKDILDFNNAATQLKSVNDQIFNATVKGEMPNDLLDKQDQLVGQMKNIAGIDVTTDKYGRAFISLDKQSIVNESSVTELNVTKPNEENKVSFYVGGKLKEGEFLAADVENKVAISTGSIKGLEEARGVVLTKQTDLNGFMDNLANAVNTIHTASADEDTGIDFFVKNEDTQQYAVNKDLLANPSKLVTGKSLENAVSGDGSRAKEIADLQHTPFEDDPTGSTLFNQYNKMVTDMGIVKQQADNMVANQTDLTALLEQRKASISGVDINEEVVNMIQFQSAFQANARVLSTISEMLDTLINRTGV